MNIISKIKAFFYKEESHWGSSYEALKEKCSMCRFELNEAKHSISCHSIRIRNLENRIEGLSYFIDNLRNDVEKLKNRPIQNQEPYKDIQEC